MAERFWRGSSKLCQGACPRQRRPFVGLDRVCARATLPLSRCRFQPVVLAVSVIAVRSYPNTSRGLGAGWLLEARPLGGEEVKGCNRPVLAGDRLSSRQ